ncbi:prolyl oligopeptidase family serine peptidase [Persicobacter diffluens]|uniref:Phospholipase n=1 Tax=Persicobacter diffluens TaxID=981 RepID=A0AAN5AJB4_9BACT|nr:phospholipase [Persicobacter diffluens]
MKSILPFYFVFSLFYWLTIGKPHSVQAQIIQPSTDYKSYPAVVTKPLDHYQRKVFVQGKDSLQYRILFPDNFNPQKSYPLVLMIHGMGERGNNNASQLNNGGAFFLDSAFRKAHPAIVVFPQCPLGTRWDSKVMPGTAEEQYGNAKTQWYWQYQKAANKDLQLLMDFVADFTKRSGYIDQSRCYVGGISMGAMTAFELAYRMPDTFAAGYFMSGGGNPADIAEKLPHMAFRLMHGDADNVVDYSYSLRMYEALKAAGISVKLDTYPGLGHGPWNDTMFQEPGLMDWLFEYKK